MSETITFERAKARMDLRTLFAIIGAVSTATGMVTGQLYSIHQELKQFHQDSWQIRDQVEFTHQSKELHGALPDVSEVLRVTRQNER
jgi:hypothetical protein